MAKKHTLAGNEGSCTNQAGAKVAYYEPPLTPSGTGYWSCHGCGTSGQGQIAAESHAADCKKRR